jgi:hypothetical protein
MARPWKIGSNRITAAPIMAASAMKPIIEVAVKVAPNSQWPSRMPISVSGMASG